MNPSRVDLRVAIRLAASLFVFYLLFVPGHFKGSDEWGVFEATQSLWERGDLSVASGPHVFTGRDGRLYSHFAIGQSVLALPFYGLGKLAARVLPDAWVRALAGRRNPPQGAPRSSGTVEIFAAGLYAPFMSGLLVALFFLFERQLGVSLRSALLASGVLGLATYVAMMSAYFLRHTTEALAILGSLYAIHAYRQSGGWAALCAGSLLASLTLLVRVPAAVAGPALGGYLVWAVRERVRKQDGVAALAPTAAAVVLPFALVAAISVAVNHAKWGNWIWSPMLAQVSGFGAAIYVGVAGLLLSPGGSIFAYSPPLLLLPWTLPGFWRRHRAECATVLALSLSFLVVCAQFWSWSGLWSSPGPRYLFVVTPLLMLPLGPWLDARRSRLERVGLSALALLGVGVQLVLMAASWLLVIQAEYAGVGRSTAFLFAPERSPIVASARAVLRGDLDPWLWKLARGWPGHAGEPGAALAVLLVWGVCFGICLALLRRSVRDAGAAGKGPPVSERSRTPAGP